MTLSAGMGGCAAGLDTRESCHVCGVKQDASDLTICEPDRKGADALACCESCARNRSPAQFVGRSPRRLGNSVAASLAENKALRSGMRETWCDRCAAQCQVPIGVRPRLCDDCRAVPSDGKRVDAVVVDELPSWVTQAAMPKFEGVVPDAIKAESVPPYGCDASLPLPDAARLQFDNLRLWLDAVLPSGRGKSVALTHLDTARLWALSVAGEVKP